MFQKFSNKKKDVKITVVNDTNPVDIIKTIFIALIFFLVLFNFLSGKNVVNSSDGVVFVNVSNEYDNIKSSYDSTLINKVASCTKDCPAKVSDKPSHNVFVIDYIGSMMASEVVYLKSKVDAILLKGNKDDEVIINISSPGGAVSGYGLVASEINRLKSAGYHITTTVDRVAASGGYMAAVVSDEIVAAPFSMVGSIGVVANVLIYEDLLKELGIQSNVYTSGESKRTVVPTKVPTKEEEAKLEEQLEAIHESFKQHILKFRPNVNVERVFTGEAFLAVDAVSLGLIDRIGTSSDLLLSKYKDGHRLVRVEYRLNESATNSFINTISSQFVEEVTSKILNNSVVFH